MKGFREYDTATASIREFAQPLSLCRSIITFLDRVDQAVADARRQLAQALAAERFDDLDERMQIEGQALESFLQEQSEINLSNLIEDQCLTTDLEDFLDRFVGATMQPAFDLASYLLRSKF